MNSLLKNWKTTLAGALGVLLIVLKIVFPQTFTTEIVTTIGFLLGSLGLVAAKDGSVTGIGSQATTIIKDVLPIVSDLTATSTDPTVKEIHTIVKSIQASQSNPVIVNVEAPTSAAVVV
jgi:hypothetical protein